MGIGRLWLPFAVDTSQMKSPKQYLPEFRWSCRGMSRTMYRRLDCLHIVTKWVSRTNEQVRNGRTEMVLEKIQLTVTNLIQRVIA